MDNQNLTKISEEELQELSNAEIRLLRGLPPWERYELLRTSLHAKFRKGDALFNQGDPVEALYVIKSGIRTDSI